MEEDWWAAAAAPKRKRRERTAGHKRRLSQVDMSSDWPPPAASLSDSPGDALPYFTTEVALPFSPFFFPFSHFLPLTQVARAANPDELEDGYRLTKRVSLDGPLILKLGENKGKDEVPDTGDNEMMDWEAGPGYYARAQDDDDYCHPYREVNEVLRSASQWRRGK